MNEPDDLRPKRPLTIQSGPFPQTHTTVDIINLGLGQPSPSLLPITEIGAAAARRLGAGADPLLLQYGSMQGYAGVRDDLARFLSAEYRYPVRPEELLITAGNSTAIALAGQVFARATGTVICEDPTYFLAHGILAGLANAVVGVPCDEGGLRVDLLERWLGQAGNELELVYCIPNFHNPTSVSLAPERAERLVELAERHDFIVIADEPYGMLQHGGAPPPCMVSHDRGRGRVLSLGSFSKILGPGLRLGWAHGDPALIERLRGHGSLRSGGALNPVVSAIVHDTLASGFLTAHVAMLRETFARRAAALSRALVEQLPSAKFVEPAGGYFTWVELAEGLDSSALLEPLRGHGVGFTPGQQCGVGRDLRRYIRLCFAFYDEDELELGVRRLARGLREHA